MKKIYTIIISLLLVASYSCNDWLDVDARSVVERNALYLNEEGFKKSLIGVYIMLAQKELYGKNTSMYLPELLARNWPGGQAGSTNKEELTAYEITAYNYTHKNVEPILSTVWVSYYQAIAQLNDLLAELETTGTVFTHNNEKLMKGEALGLRAFLHLELLRYFGPIPSKNPSGELAIPYVTELTKDPNKLISIPYSEVIKLIEKDLIAAENILQDYDPIIRFTPAELNSALSPINHRVYPHIKDEWQMKRQARFNYYAVLGTKARFYHWTGDKENAMANAKIVIDATNEHDSSVKFQLTTNSDFTTTGKSSLTMVPEHLFCIHNPALLEIVDALYKGNKAILTYPNEKLVTEQIYEAAYYSVDIRHYTGDRYWNLVNYESGAKKYHYSKYTGTNAIKTDYKIPLIRVVEMYFILIENLPEGDPQAATYFSQYRDKRGLPATLDAPTLASKAATMKRLELEHRKEFMAEGQMFFFFKRLNYDKFTFPINYPLDQEKVYVLPKPKDQIAFE